MSNKKIMIVEDEILIAEAIKDILIKRGYNVPQIAMDSEDAIPGFKKCDPDLVLMDINLPGDMNGITLAEKMKSTRDLSIIFITAYSDPEIMEKAISIKPDGYIIKPVNPIQLLSAIQMAFSKREYEITLRESESRYRHLFDNSKSCITIYQAIESGKNFKYVNMNKQAEMLEFIKRDNLIGRTVRDRYPNIGDFKLFRVLQRVWETGKAESCPIVAYENRQISSWIEYFVYKLPSGEVVTIYTDETKKRWAEDKIIRGRNEWENTFDAITDLVCIIDNEFKIIRANCAAKRLSGLAISDIVGRDIFELFTINKKNWAREIKKVFRMGAQREFEFFDRRTETWFWITIYPIFVDNERVVSSVVVLKDITDQKIAEKAIRDKEDIFKALSKQSIVGIAILQNEEIIFANEAIIEFTGYSFEDLSSWDLPDLIKIVHPDDREMVLANHNIITKSKKPNTSVQYNFRIITSSGKIKWLLLNMKIFSLRESPSLFLSFIDITNLKDTINLLSESEERFRTIVETAPGMLQIINNKGKNIYLSPNCKEITGYSQEELIEDFKWWIHEDDMPKALEMLRQTINNRRGYRDFEYKGIRKNGKTWYGSSSWEVVTDNEGRLKWIVLQTIDISKRKKIENELKLSEQRLKGIISSITEQMSIIDNEHTIIWANNTVIDMFGSDIIGQKCYCMYHRGFLRCGNCIISQAFSDGRFHEQEREVVNAKGEKMVFWSTSSTVGWGKGGSPEHVIIISRDITQKRINEEKIKKTNEELRNLTANIQQLMERWREYLAQEIHDSLGQDITVLRIELLNILEDLLDIEGSKEDAEKVQDILDLIDRTIDTIRNICSELRPRILDDLGLVAAIDWHSRQIEKRTKIRITRSLEMEDENIDKDMATTVFRIYQEIMTNILRHANASEVVLNLNRNNNNLLMEIRDNGIGISENKIHDSFSIGLISMRERALFLNGEFSIKRGEESGTVASVRIPLYSDHE